MLSTAENKLCFSKKIRSESLQYVSVNVALDSESGLFYNLNNNLNLNHFQKLKPWEKNLSHQLQHLIIHQRVNMQRDCIQFKLTGSVLRYWKEILTRLKEEVTLDL